MTTNAEVEAPQPFLSHYADLGFVPTRQAGGLPALFARRKELYLRLGIAPALIRDRRVVEFGPGSGENTEYTASLEPAHYTLVDGSTAALNASGPRVTARLGPERVTTIETTFLEYTGKQDYDVVLAEGLLSFQAHPARTMAAIATAVADGGLLVVSCMDAPSLLAESLRKFIAIRIAPLGTEIIARSEVVVDFFSEDLAHLPAMTRYPHDWALDHVLQPFLGPPFSIGDALATLGSDFRLVGSSPAFMRDWRWYKEYSDDPAEDAAWQIAQYESVLHVLADKRAVPEVASAQDNTVLQSSAQKIFFATEAAILGTPYSDSEVADDLMNLIDGTPHLAPVTVESILAFVAWLGSGNQVDLQGFRSWWGRGQQYLSFVRV